MKKLICIFAIVTGMMLTACDKDEVKIENKEIKKNELSAEQ